MKFAIGYQVPANGERFSAIVEDYRDRVAEVYFPWPGMPSGRQALGYGPEGTDFFAREELAEELQTIRRLGVKLDLLFNANCYGDYAVSARFESEIVSVLKCLGAQELLPEIVTTTSPFVAAVIRKHFPEMEIRASVNMRIDSTLAMEYLSDVFDSFHIRRDLQRDLPTVRQFHQWCETHGKKLCMLANSGCLRNCPAQSFHDNLVAHDAAIREIRAVPDFQPHLCWKLYRNKENFVNFLKSSWIRPEDLKYYEPYFPVVKLATRLHTHPRMVIGAYAEGEYHGDLLALTEPGFGPAFAPYFLDNDRFPADWHELAGKCAINCSHCGKCEEVLRAVLQKNPEFR